MRRHGLRQSVQVLHRAANGPRLDQIHSFVFCQHPEVISHSAQRMTKQIRGFARTEQCIWVIDGHEFENSSAQFVSEHLRQHVWRWFGLLLLVPTVRQMSLRSSGIVRRTTAASRVRGRAIPLC